MSYALPPMYALLFVAIIAVIAVVAATAATLPADPAPGMRESAALPAVSFDSPQTVKP